MNALPVGGERLRDAEFRKRYFDDLERWGFDVAYNAFYAHSYEDVVGKFKEPYVEFATEAHRRGFPACIQIRPPVATLLMPKSPGFQDSPSRGHFSPRDAMPWLFSNRGNTDTMEPVSGSNVPVSWLLSLKTDSIAVCHSSGERTLVKILIRPMR